MTILVGYRPQRSGRAALHLAAMLARSAGEPIAVVTVVPQPWRTPSMARVDAEFVAWAQGEGEKVLAQARAFVAEAITDVEVTFHTVTGRSVSSALLGALDEHAADVLVLGSSSEGGHGQVVVGSTADRLLHSSHVPVAVAPRGFHADPGARVGRVTCSFAGVAGSFEVLLLTAQITERVGAALRIATFGVRGRTMYPPEVSIDVEDDVLAQWARQAVQAQAEALADLRAKNVCPEPTTTEVGSGPSWTEAMEDLQWAADDVMVVGSSSVGPIARVFLGQRANKIVRYSPVPVIVVPAAAVDG